MLVEMLRYFGGILSQSIEETIPRHRFICKVLRCNICLAETVNVIRFVAESSVGINSKIGPKLCHIFSCFDLFHNGFPLFGILSTIIHQKLFAVELLKGVRE